MDWEVIGPMIVAVVFIVTMGGVLVLRPIAKRLGTLLEMMAQQKAGLPADQLRNLRSDVETMGRRLELMEERQDFTERLLERGGPRGSPENASPKEPPRT